MPLRVMKMDDCAEVYVGESPMINVPLEYQDNLEPVFERLYEGMNKFYAGVRNLPMGFVRRSDKRKRGLTAALRS